MKTTKRNRLVDAALTELDGGADDSGICLKCEEVTGGVEPDASGYECPACGESFVMGAADVVLRFGAF